MKYFRLLVALALLPLFSRCASDAVIQEHMLIDPHTLNFTGTDTVKTVAITHTCSCPFTWSDRISGGGSWLVFTPGMSGDHTDLKVTVLRSLLPADTNHAVIYVSSNGYGNDTIGVNAIR